MSKKIIQVSISFEWCDILDDDLSNAENSLIGDATWNTKNGPWNYRETTVKQRETPWTHILLRESLFPKKHIFSTFSWVWMILDCICVFVVFTSIWSRRSRFAHAQLFLARVAVGKGSLPIIVADPAKEVLEKVKERKTAIESRMGPVQSALYRILNLCIYITLV